ncbi:hypothetical protein [Pseudonocardia hydrocarbonoxydans]|uniref:hypothetical protein n=1 Tax=Pseudonocardia hydrocarbonoxydans TaxID=76726 RepID=UPI0014775837|nr:hypothetical protein [Pseudonocardia hydrocarbonoxydans]
MSTLSTPTPADYVDAPRRELLDALTAAEGVLVDNSHGIGAPRTPDDVRHAALVALATARALAVLLLRFEPWTQLDALRAGAPLVDVAAACGLDVDEVLAGLRSRVAGQVEHGLMPRTVADELLAAVEHAAASPPA